MKEDETISAAIVKISSPIITSTSSKIAQSNGITSPLINNENLKNYINENSSFNGKLTLEEEHHEEEEELKADEPTMDLKITESAENKPATAEEESCFKTPALPTPNKKTKPSTNKKRQPSKVSADLVNGKIPCNDQTSNIGDGAVGVVDIDTSAQSMVLQYTDEELVREFVSIGKHSFFCPHSQQFLAKKYPSLNLTRNLEDDKKEDIIKEIVIDEFSLLLFQSMDDFNKMKEHEDKIKEREEAEAKQKQYEENLRLGKIKKKGRKSKIELKREHKVTKRRARKEQRRREKEERRQSKLAQKQGQQSISLLPEEKEMQRKDEIIQNKAEREKQRREERKQLKQAKKINNEKKRQLEKRASKNSAAVQQYPHSSSAISESLVLPSISNSTLPQSQLDNKTAVAKIKIEKLNTENQRPEERLQFKNNNGAENFIGSLKRPSSAAIGIATVHRNGLIQSPTNNLLLSAMPPASKMPKYESAGLEEYGANKQLLIGIAVSSASVDQSIDKNQLDATKSASEKDFLQRVSGSVSSIATTSNQYQLLSQQQEQLQQAFLKNPELAYNFLYSIDNRATTGSVGLNPFNNSGGGSPIKAAATPFNQSQQQKSSQNESRISTTPLLSSFPLGMPLASQLALATSQSTKMAAVGQHPNPSIPFKSGRWCNMHAVIAHEIYKHQDSLKKSPVKTSSIAITGRQSLNEKNHLEKKTSLQQHKMMNNSQTPNIAATTSQQLQQNEERNGSKASIGSNFASSSASNSSTTSINVNNNATTTNLQQQLNLFLAQQRQLDQNQQQMTNSSTLNDSLLNTSNLLARLQRATVAAKPSSSIHDSLLSSAKSALGLPSMPQQLFSTSTSSTTSSSAYQANQQIQQQAANQQLFGRFPVQPLGPGTGSLTSGNSDAAAAAQLQQQAQLLASLQQQQAQFAALQQFPQNALSLISQFGAEQLPSNSSLIQQQQQSLLSALVNNPMMGNGIQFPVGFGQNGQPSILPSTFDAFQSNQQLQTLPQSTLNQSHPLFASGNNENVNAKSESILAAFLSGQTIEPKMAFPPQLPSSSSSSVVANPPFSPALSIEQQLMREGQLSGQLQKLSNTVGSASSAIPPPPSFLIGAGSTATAMNALGIEQELLMRQLRIAQQQQQMANGIGAATTTMANIQNGPQKGGARAPMEMLGQQNARQI